MNELLLSSDVFQVEIVPTLFSFILCVLMSFILRYFYIRRSYSLTGKSHIGSILPILSTVVFLVIVVVKSSLALSLGLVGALSIVRFRTPIKEPEELVYLFLAISIGLGFASGQNLITTLLTLLILLIIYFWLSNKSLSSVTEYNLILNWKDKTLMFEDLIDQVKSCSKDIKLIRVDNSPTESTAVLLVSPEDDSFVDLITNKLIPLDNEISVTFFEAKTNW